MADIIICGLTDYEKKEIREHKGECRYCEYNESWFDRGEVVKECRKNGRLDQFKTDCKDWKLDMR